LNQDTTRSALELGVLPAGCRQNSYGLTKQLSAASGSPWGRTRRFKKAESGQQMLRMLVVKDDAIKLQIVQKRLRMDKPRLDPRSETMLVDNPR
jgi:hypothetical protein